MKTMICATLVALACVASIGLPAAAEDVVAGFGAASAGGGFGTLEGVPAAVLSQTELDGVRGGIKYIKITMEKALELTFLETYWPSSSR